MTSKLKTDILETVSGSGTIALTNQLSGMTTASLPTLTSAEMPVGSVLQVINAFTTTEVAIGSGTSTYADTGLTATITPTSTSSKILVIFTLQQFMTQVAGYGRNKLVRGSTDIREFGFALYAGASTIMGHQTGQFLDSPSTTSATTYKLMFNSGLGNINCQYDDGNGDSVSTITLMEIKG